MASNRDDPLSYTTNQSSSSSPITVSDHLDPSSSYLGSASNSFQNDSSFLQDSVVSTNNDVSEFGFSRSDFRQLPLSGSVEFYQRHVFLCYKNPAVWPPRIEAAEFDRLPRLLSAAVLSRKPDMKKETRLTICEGHDGSKTSNGDVLIFPDMIRYRRLTHFDVDTFVDEVLVKNVEWHPGTPEKLEGSYVFVCCHGSRDRRCGVCGPALVSRFKEEIDLRGLQGKISVSPCSHIGGHKYAGNVIIFGSSTTGGVTGHWYGYVTPDDVPLLIEQHIGKGEILEWMWRGQMGLLEDDQIKSQEERLYLNGEAENVKIVQASPQRQVDDANGCVGSSETEVTSCCQQNGNSSCCKSPVLAETKENLDADKQPVTVTSEKKISKKPPLRINSGKGSSSRKVCAMPTWLESWEREDTYAALAVACAAVSVFVAYKCYKQL